MFVKTLSSTGKGVLLASILYLYCDTVFQYFLQSEAVNILCNVLAREVEESLASNVST